MHLGAAVEIYNSILWNNSADEILIFNGSGTATVTYSDIDVSPIWPGTGNINDDPFFLDPFNGDYRLAFGSLAINAGDNTVVLDDNFDVDQDGDLDEATPDLDLLERIINEFVDMGSYEALACP